MHRRITWFGLSSQAMQMGALFFAGHCVQWLVRLLAGDGLMPLAVLVAPVLEGLLWPLAVVLLLAPQRRPHDVDENRPL
jgi:rod shape-determining protein MreD